MIANMQVEQQHNNKQLFNELRNVDADAQRFVVNRIYLYKCNFRVRRDTEAQNNKIQQLERKIASSGDGSTGINLEWVVFTHSFIRKFRKYSRVLRSVETKERELDRKIRETDAILREVKSLKVSEYIYN